MTKILALGATLALACTAMGSEEIFPYRYFIDDLSNGLRLVTVPTDFPDLVDFWVIVRAGSRNEVEPGKSYHVWIMAAAATPGPNGKLDVEAARSGQGHVKPYRRLHADDVDLPLKQEKKSLWAKLSGRK